MAKSSTEIKKNIIRAAFEFASNIDRFKKVKGVGIQQKKEILGLLLEIQKIIDKLDLSQAELNKVPNFIKPNIKSNEYKKLKRCLELYFKKRAALNTIAIDIGENIGFTESLLMHGVEYIFYNLKGKDFKAITNSETKKNIKKKTKSGSAFGVFLRTVFFIGLLVWGGKWAIDNLWSSSGIKVHKIIKEYRTDKNLSDVAQKVTNTDLKVAGSSSLVNIISEIKPDFKNSYPRLNLSTAVDDSGIAIRKLIAGQIDIAASSRMPSVAERKESKIRSRLLADHKVAMDAVAIIVNPSNPIESLSVEDLMNIFSQEPTWKDYSWLGNLNTIERITSSPESGTYGFFRERVMFTEKISADVVKVYNTQHIIDMVSENPNAIGVISASQVKTDKVKALKISTMFHESGVSPFISAGLLNATAIKRGEYPLTRYLYLISAGDLTEPVANMIDYLRSPNGQKALAEKGLFSIY